MMPRTRRKFTKERPPDPDALDAPQRVFVACPLPGPLHGAIDRLTGQLEASELPIRWVGGSSAHLTLLFIGEVPLETVEILRLGLPRGMAGLPSVKLQVDGAGAFPSIEQPNVVWLGLKGDVAGLQKLRTRVVKTLASLSFEIEPEPFKPHITLGRSRQPLKTPQRDSLQRLLKTERLRAEIPKALLAPFEIREVQLVRSVLGPDGATHTAIQSYPLVTLPPPSGPTRTERETGEPVEAVELAVAAAGERPPTG